MHRIAYKVLAACSAICLGGCDPVSLTAFGVGASQGVSHTLNGITYRTFTAPMSQVRGATLSALNRMGIKVVSTGKSANGETIKAKATDREIEIELEALTSNTTRMRAVARNGGVFYDAATATEIVLQTEKALGRG